MKKIITVILSGLVLVCCVEAQIEVSFTEQPGWKNLILEKVSFSAAVKENKKLLGEDADDGDGFIVFSCTAKENLGKRVLWIEAELTFSNGYKRNFESISFMILEKGTEYDIRKVPFDRASSPLFSKEENETESLEVIKMLITQIALK